MREVKVTHIFIFSHFPNYKLWQKFHQNGHESRKVSSHVMFPFHAPTPLQVVAGREICPTCLRDYCVLHSILSRQ